MIALILTIFFEILGILLQLVGYILVISIKLILGLLFWPLTLLGGGKSTPKSKCEDAYWDGVMMGWMMSDDD